MNKISCDSKFAWDYRFNCNLWPLGFTLGLTNHDYFYYWIKKHSKHSTLNLC